METVPSTVFASTLIEFGYTDMQARHRIFDLIRNQELILNSKYWLVEGNKTVTEAMIDSIETIPSLQ